MNEPIHISDETFDDVTTKSGVPVIVDFWAEWCGPCRMLLPHLDHAAKEYEDKLVIAKMNVDENSEKAMEFQVQAIPTLLFYKNGEQVYRHTGSMGYAQLKELIDQYLM